MSIHLFGCSLLEEHGHPGDKSLATKIDPYTGTFGYNY